MDIRLHIVPKNEKEFIEKFREFLNAQAQDCQETIMIDGKLVVQETSAISKAWFYHIEKEKKRA